MNKNKDYITVKSPTTKEAIILKTNIPYSEKEKLVNELMERFDLRINAISWETDSTRYFIDALTNYLLNHEETIAITEKENK